MKRILLVEDEPGLVLTLTDRLIEEGYAVDSATNGVRALEQAAKTSFDLILLDVMLPGKSGWDVCQELRQRGLRTPILMLTARGQITDKVHGLKLGADDYLVKPFEMAELLARIEALLRRSEAAPATPQNVHQFGPLRVDLLRGKVWRNDELISLSTKEWELLRYFVEHPFANLSREELLEKVWGYGASTSSRTLDVHVASLRQKIEPDPRQPQYVQTVHGTGYRFVAE